MPTTYKVSCVVLKGNHPGAILNLDHRPEVGERVTLGDHDFIVVEVIDLIPSRGDFHYIHATLRPAED